MATKKKEEPEAEEMVFYKHPDGHLQEMTRSEADALEKKQGGDISAAPESGDWKEEIKTRE